MAWIQEQNAIRHGVRLFISNTKIEAKVGNHLARFSLPRTLTWDLNRVCYEVSAILSLPGPDSQYGMLSPAGDRLYRRKEVVVKDVMTPAGAAEGLSVPSRNVNCRELIALVVEANISMRFTMFIVPGSDTNSWCVAITVREGCVERFGSNVWIPLNPILCLNPYSDRVFTSIFRKDTLREVMYQFVNERIPDNTTESMFAFFKMDVTSINGTLSASNYLTSISRSIIMWMSDNFTQDNTLSIFRQIASDGFDYICHSDMQKRYICFKAKANTHDNLTHRWVHSSNSVDLDITMRMGAGFDGSGYQRLGIREVRHELDRWDSDWEKGDALETMVQGRNGRRGLFHHIGPDVLRRIANDVRMNDMKSCICSRCGNGFRGS
jgi:hypothetical protein